MKRDTDASPSATSPFGASRPLAGGRSKSARDPDRGPRRLRVMQSLVMQGIIALVLLGMAWFSRDETRWLALYLVTLVVPVGWALVLWNALGREEKARDAGSWTKEMAASERKRGQGMLGILFVGWVVVALAIVWLL